MQGNNLTYIPSHVHAALEQAVLLHPMVFQAPPMLNQSQMFLSESIRAKEACICNTGANCSATPHGIPKSTYATRIWAPKTDVFQRASGRQKNMWLEHWSQLFCYNPWHSRTHPDATPSWAPESTTTTTTTTTTSTTKLLILLSTATTTTTTTTTATITTTAAPAPALAPAPATLTHSPTTPSTPSPSPSPSPTPAPKTW